MKSNRVQIADKLYAIMLEIDDMYDLIQTQERCQEINHLTQEASNNLGKALLKLNKKS